MIPQVELFQSFFGRIEDTQKTFRNWLTFSSRSEFPSNWVFNRLSYEITIVRKIEVFGRTEHSAVLKYFAYLLIQVIVSTPLVKSSFRIKVSRKNSKRSFWGRCGRFLKFYQIQKINAFWEGHKIRKNIPYFFYACTTIPIAENLGDFLEFCGSPQKTVT